MVKCITFDDGGKGDFGTNKSKIPGLGNHYSVTLIYFFQNFQFIGRYTVMILVPKSRKYRISEYHYIVKFIFFIPKITNYRSIYYSDFGTKKKSKILHFTTLYSEFTVFIKKITKYSSNYLFDFVKNNYKHHFNIKLGFFFKRYKK